MSQHSELQTSGSSKSFSESPAAQRTIVVGSDHAGFDLKIGVAAYLKAQGWQVLDVGCHSTDSVDYPAIAAVFAETMRTKASDWGILVCGSGVGVCMGANRFAHLRAVLAHDETTARMSRRHNNANVLCLGGRVIALPLAQEIINTWLSTPFEGGRHEFRVTQLGQIANHCLSQS